MYAGSFTTYISLLPTVSNLFVHVFKRVVLVSDLSGLEVWVCPPDDSCDFCGYVGNPLKGKWALIACGSTRLTSKVKLQAPDVRVNEHNLFICDISIFGSMPLKYRIVRTFKVFELLLYHTTFFSHLPTPVLVFHENTSE